MLSALIMLPLVGAFALLFIDRTNTVLVRNFSLFWSLLVFNCSVFLLAGFDPLVSNFQFIESISWLPFANSDILFAVDGLSILLIILTTFLIPVCVLLCWKMPNQTLLKDYNIAFLLLEAILIGIFCSLDLLVFYLLFEAVLIPMFFIVGIFGSRERKVRASYLLFLYTLVSSILLFVAILFIYFKTGTTNYLLLKTFEFDPVVERLCWLAFFSSFAVKMPLVPFHIWLPEAHCEAPTAGSVILAGILLKLGGYGFLRFSIGLFPESSNFFTPLVFVLSSFGVVYASLTTLQQVDLKKIIAYSSVGHMGLVTIGIFSSSIQGILGSIVLMISHGITSGALFVAIGILYERHHTRVVRYYSGLIHTMPLFSVCFIIFTLANLGLPCTSNFVGECFVIVGCFKVNSWSAFFAACGMVLGAGYSLWLCNRIIFGNVKQHSIVFFKDLDRRESFIFLPFVFLTFLIGLYPDIVLNFVGSSFVSM
jgi:NADH-quinone oxidoreductase subunit M